MKDIEARIIRAFACGMSLTGFCMLIVSFVFIFGEVQIMYRSFGLIQILIGALGVLLSYARQDAADKDNSKRLLNEAKKLLKSAAETDGEAWKLK